MLNSFYFLRYLYHYNFQLHRDSWPMISAIPWNNTHIPLLAHTKIRSFLQCSMQVSKTPVQNVYLSHFPKMEGKSGHIWLYYAGGNEVNIIGCYFFRVCNTFAFIQRYTFFCVCVPRELKPQPFALLTQCSTAEPQEHLTPIDNNL